MRFVCSDVSTKVRGALWDISSIARLSNLRPEKLLYTLLLSLAKKACQAFLYITSDCSAIHLNQKIDLALASFKV